MLQICWWFTKIFERKSTKKNLNLWKLTNTGVIVYIICEHNLHLGERRFNDKLTQYSDLTILSGGSRGGARGVRPPLFLDQTEARRAENNVGDRPPPPFHFLISGSGWPGSPLSWRSGFATDPCQIVSIYLNIVFNNTTRPLFLEFK